MRILYAILALCLLSCTADKTTKPVLKAEVLMHTTPSVFTFPEDEEQRQAAARSEAWTRIAGGTPTPSVPYRVKYDGMLKNTGDATAHNVTVIFTFYDSAGLVIGVDQSWCMPPSLSPGRLGTFSQEWGCCVGLGFSYEDPVNSYSCEVSWDTDA